MRAGLAVAGMSVAAVAVVLACGGAPALAHDSLAPPGARHRWLPREPWVRHHWVPYDESHLYSVLGIDTAGLFEWLRDDHRTLAQLARRRGVSPRGLATRLLEPRRSEVPARSYPVLRERAERTLTQGHLAQHLFFHVFHGVSPAADVKETFGVSRRTYRRLRRRGWTPLQIAGRGGRSPETVRAHMHERLAAEAAAAGWSMSKAQGDRMLARQRRLVDCWLESPHAKFDRDNPFGQKWSGHPPHPRGSRVGITDPKPPLGCWQLLLVA
ncbi:MAG: hypothetical protein M3133_09125 [Actinomycetota bacterium]|nr:hypothetical protein [Actinomycetota bacterium]